MEDFYLIRLLATHAYALVDRVALSGEMPADWPLKPLVPRGFDNETHLLPALLPLNELSEEQRMDLLETLHNPPADSPLPVVTLLDSEADPERMRLHWANHLIIRMPDGGLALLRSYDPRVFALLQWMFSPAQLVALFGPIRRWTLCLDGEWQTLSPPAQDGIPDAPISIEQAAYLSRIGQINRVLFQLPKEQRRPHETVSRAINTLLERAEAYGLAHEDDQRTFAWHGMTVHPHFDSASSIQTLLHAVSDAEHTLSQAFSALDAAQWQRIADEAESAARHPDKSMNEAQA